MTSTTRKYCAGCDKTRDRSKFGMNRSAPDGLAWYCRDCSNEKQREWKASNPEKLRKWRKAYTRRIRQANGAEG